MIRHQFRKGKASAAFSVGYFVYGNKKQLYTSTKLTRFIKDMGRTIYIKKMCFWGYYEKDFSDDLMFYLSDDWCNLRDFVDNWFIQTRINPTY
jgi:cytochrome c2